MVTRRPSSAQTGFSLLFVLFSIALLSITLTAASLVWSTELREQKERELLFVGQEYRNAIRSYYLMIPGRPEYPTSLQSLILDPRFPNTVRHLRKIYPDPLTGHALALVRDPQGGGIMGVYSNATGTPVKVAGFDLADGQFKNASSYAQWLFIFTPIDSKRL